MNVQEASKLHVFCFMCPPRFTSAEVRKNSTSELRQQMLQRLIDQKTMCHSLQMTDNMDPSKLPLRELPHGKASCIFSMYQGFLPETAVTAALPNLLHLVLVQ